MSISAGSYCLNKHTIWTSKGRKLGPANKLGTWSATPSATKPTVAAKPSATTSTKLSATPSSSSIKPTERQLNPTIRPSNNLRLNIIPPDELRANKNNGKTYDDGVGKKLPKFRKDLFDKRIPRDERSSLREPLKLPDKQGPGKKPHKKHSISGVKFVNNGDECLNMCNDGDSHVGQDKSLYLDNELNATSINGIVETRKLQLLRRQVKSDSCLTKPSTKSSLSPQPVPVSQPSVIAADNNLISQQSDSVSGVNMVDDKVKNEKAYETLNGRHYETILECIKNMRSNSVDSDTKVNGESKECDDELEYGPGIVKRLKSKFLKYALINAHQKENSEMFYSKTLKRSSSLENVLDRNDHIYSEPVYKEKLYANVTSNGSKLRPNGKPQCDVIVDGISNGSTNGITTVQRHYIPNGKICKPNSKASGTKLVMKKAQSMETLLNESNQQSNFLDQGRLPLTNNNNCINSNGNNNYNSTNNNNNINCMKSNLKNLNNPMCQQYEDQNEFSVPKTITNTALVNENVVIIQNPPDSNEIIDECNKKLNGNNNNSVQMVNQLNKSSEVAVIAEVKPKVLSKSSGSSNSIIFDFRGINVKPNVAIQPTPFGFNSMTDTKRKTNGEDDDEIYSGSLETPQPSGIIFEGESVIIGSGNLMARRNKKLSIRFDDASTETFAYPSEASLLAEFDSDSDQKPMCESDNIEEDTVINPMNSSEPTTALSNLKNNLVIGGSTGGLASYKPSALTDDTSFQLGVSRPAEKMMNTLLCDAQIECNANEMLNGHDVDAIEMLKPADSSETVTWSSSTSSSASDLLF